MLWLDPNKRPCLAHVMAHPWLAPILYRLPVALGALPCSTKKGLERPLTPTVAERLARSDDSFASTKRSPSPFAGTTMHLSLIHI